MNETEELMLAATNDLESPKADASFIEWLRNMIACLDMEEEL
jgi:hypothetical protein